jgi:hypothetical protein
MGTRLAGKVAIVTGYGMNVYRWWGIGGRPPRVIC